MLDLSHTSWRAWLSRYLLALTLVSLITAGSIFGGTWYLNHKFNQAKEVAVELDDKLPGATNFLILGSDSRAFITDEADKRSFGSTGDVGGQRADAIIIARVEPKTHHGLLVSLPRDLRVQYPGKSGLRKINESFDHGPQGVIDVIKANFDVPINHYLELNFAGFRSMVDAIGGVRMYIPSPVRDKQTGLSVTTPGCVTLDGKQALAWVRSRHYTYLEAGRWRTDPTGDIGRIERQQEFIRRLMTQAASRGALNPLRANRLANAALGSLTVDGNFHVKDALRLVRAFRAVGPAAVEMLALPTKSVPYGLRPLPEAEPLLARLRGDAPVDSKEPSVAPSDVRVRVLNGKGSPGLAGDTSAALSGVGFTVSQPADADRLYARTEIRYLPRFQAKAELLARYLGGVGRFVADPALRNLDVVLVAGADFKGVTERPGPARSGPATPTTTTTVTTTATTAPTPTTKASRPANPTGVAPQPAC